MFYANNYSLLTVLNCLKQLFYCLINARSSLAKHGSGQWVQKIWIHLVISEIKGISLQNILPIQWLRRGHNTGIITGNVGESSWQRKKEENTCQNTVHVNITCQYGWYRCTWILWRILRAGDTGSRGSAHVLGHFSRSELWETGLEMRSPPENCPAGSAQLMRYKRDDSQGKCWCECSNSLPHKEQRLAVNGLEN